MGIEEDLLSVFQREAVPVKNGTDVKLKSEKDFNPLTKEGVSYIGQAVLFDDAGNVLLIQEADKSYRGKWNFPYGHLDQGETIMDAAVRGVKEQAGFDCELTTLLCVKLDTFIFIRFTFFGKITGGNLKTAELKDRHSLQAKFFSKDELQFTSRDSLRHDDTLRFIELGRKYMQADPASRCPDLMPVKAPHSRIIHRVVMIDRSSTSAGTIHVLANTEETVHIPTILMDHTGTTINVSAHTVLRDVFIGRKVLPSVRLCGILGLEHSGRKYKQEDGMCITTLISLDLSEEKPEPPAITSSTYQWVPVVNEDLKKLLEDAAGGKIVPLF